MPDWPAKRRCHVLCAPTPRGLTAPRPVTTTRRMLPSPKQNLVLAWWLECGRPRACRSKQWLAASGFSLETRKLGWVQTGYRGVITRCLSSGETASWRSPGFQVEAGVDAGAAGPACWLAVSWQFRRSVDPSVPGLVPLSQSARVLEVRTEWRFRNGQAVCLAGRLTFLNLDLNRRGPGQGSGWGRGR